MIPEFHQYIVQRKHICSSSKHELPVVLTVRFKFTQPTPAKEKKQTKEKL